MIRSTRYCDIDCLQRVAAHQHHHPPGVPARFSAACPAEFAAPTMYTSSPSRARRVAGRWPRSTRRAPSARRGPEPRAGGRTRRWRRAPRGPRSRVPSSKRTACTCRARLSPTTSRASTISAPSRRAWVTARCDEVGAAQPVGEAEVVLDARALAGLPTGRLALDDDGAQSLRRRRTPRPRALPGRRRRRPGRTAGSRRVVRRPSALGELDASTAPRSDRPSGSSTSGRSASSPPNRPSSRAASSSRSSVEPLVRHVVAGQEHPASRGCARDHLLPTMRTPSKRSRWSSSQSSSRSSSTGYSRPPAASHGFIR